MKVLVAFPSGDQVHSDFTMSLSRMVLYTANNTKIKIEGFLNPKSSIIQKGRHIMVRDALKTKADYLLMLDSDMTFPEDLIQQLVSHRVDIIGCNYSTRRMPYKQTAKDMNGEYFPEKMGGLQQASRVATGCLLVKLSVFEKIGTPYFNVLWDEKSQEFMGEDYNFCIKAQELGYEVYCDLDLSKYIGHIGGLTARL